MRIGMVTAVLVFSALLAATLLPAGVSGQAVRLQLSQLDGHLWVHTSWDMYEGVLTPSNGMVVVTGVGAVLIDTPWTNRQTQSLLDQVKEKFGKTIVAAYITHAHQDRIGGIEILLANQVETFSTDATARLAEAAGYPQPAKRLAAEGETYVYGGVQLEVLYPGAAHTHDNIVIYFPGSRTLFGGCIIKSLGSGSLGNVADGDVRAYPATVRNLLARYGEAVVVVPGHGNWGGPALLHHTLALAEAASRY